jgi:diaminobutyrate-2-oxoglutarate transaminase
VTATAALDFWTDTALTESVVAKGAMVRTHLEGLAAAYPALNASVRGRGLIQGLDCQVPGLAEAICREAFRHGLLIETAGPESTVVKALPPLVIDESDLQMGLDILTESVRGLVAAPQPGVLEGHA